MKAETVDAAFASFEDWPLQKVFKRVLVDRQRYFW